MTGSAPHDQRGAARPSPSFVSFSDQGLFLAHKAVGQHAAIQVLWRYRRTVDMEALARFRDHLAHGHLARLVRPALLPFGRHQWAGAPPPTSELIAGTPLDPADMQAWIDAQVALPLDPEAGPGWVFNVQPFKDGSTVVSLVISHCIADGMTAGVAVREASLGLRQPSAYRLAAPRTGWEAAATIAMEAHRAICDLPAAFRALAQFVRTSSPALAKRDKRAATGVLEDERKVVFPSAFVRVPTALWDKQARRLGGNRFTLLVAFAGAFAQRLGRVCEGRATLWIPVNQRVGPSHTGGNEVSLATVTMEADEPRGSLTALQQNLRTTLLRARREANRLTSLLPLTPFVPRRAFAAASHLALGALVDLPVTCSNVGLLPKDVMEIDGGSADWLCFRGIDQPTAISAIEARDGLATLFAGVVDGRLVLTFVAYQPGVVTEATHLREVAEELLADYELSGEFFDA